MNNKEKKKIHFTTVLLIVLPVLVIVGIVIFVIIRFKNWVNPVSLDNEVKQEDVDSYVDCYDMMVPLLDENGYVIRQDVKKVVIFGNDPFAQDADNESGMAAMLAKETGIEVINCAVEGSYIASGTELDNPTEPMDWFTPYYLTALLTYKDVMYSDMKNAANQLGDDGPSNVKQIVETLYALDPDTVDAVVYMYDFEDYWLNHKIYNSYTPYAFNTVCGNLTAAYKMIRFKYDDIRIVVMSPYYNYYVTEDGTAESSEFHSGTYGTPSGYFFSITNMTIESGDASYVDNLYGSITEDNYEKYLSDYKTLNADGRALLVSRLKDALFYYSSKSE